MNPNVKHTASLVSVSVGMLGFVISAVCLFSGIAFGKWPAAACGGIGVFPSTYLLLRGYKARNRAIEAGSTMHLEPPAERNVRTSRTEAAKPSFLKDKPSGDG